MELNTDSPDADALSARVEELKVRLGGGRFERTPLADGTVRVSVTAPDDGDRISAIGPTTAAAVAALDLKMEASAHV